MTIKTITPEQIGTTQRKIDRIFIHCSADSHTKNDNAAMMDAWHRARGWKQIGYHLFIRKDGTLEQGRDIRTIPAAQKGNNTGTIAICLHGGGGNPPANDFTEAQMKKLVAVANELHKRYPNATFHGHREVAAKACPVFDYKSALRLGPKGEYKPIVAQPAPKPKDPPPPPDIPKPSPEPYEGPEEQASKASGYIGIVIFGVAILGTLAFVILN